MTGEHHLALLAEQSLERLGDYRQLLFEGTWHSSGEIMARARRAAAAGEPGGSHGPPGASSARRPTGVHVPVQTGTPDVPRTAGRLNPSHSACPWG